MPGNRTYRVTVARRRRELTPWMTGLLLGLGIAAFAGIQLGHAQTNSPRNREELVPTQPAPPPPAGTGSQETGVIRPPVGVDPGMTKPAPNPQAFPMPVLPPPGTPGGNPQVVPK
jgi:hypothetical protein